MSSDSSIRAFKCPTCGAPLEPEPGKSSMKCPYCNDTVIIPSSLRTSGTSTVTPTFSSANFPSSSFSGAGFSGETYSPGGSSGSGSRLPMFLVGGVIALVFGVIILGAIAFFAFGFNPFGSLLFANNVMSFGSKGIGQGMFQDARAIGVDGSGNIVVADYEDGRVQTFDRTGKFVSLFTVYNGTKNALISGIAVSNDGKIYIAAQSILIYDEKGNKLGQIGDDNHDYYDVALGPDGTLYALTFGQDSLVRFKQDGSIDLEIPNVVSSITGDMGGFTHLAVDGLGNMYVVNNVSDVVLKYSPAGKFVDQFGGKLEDITKSEPGKFDSPLAIAIDGYGRIYVADSFDLQVFDADGKYINDISGGYYGITFDGQNNLYATSVTNKNVEKFQIQKPAGATTSSVNTTSNSSGPVVPTSTPDFGNSILTFGSKGIGPGMLSNDRAIAVDGDGNIIVAGYNDGRIQIFDSTGKFVSLISIGQNNNIFSLAASRDGKLYVPFGGNISIMDEAGKVQKVIKGDFNTRYYTHVALGSDGTLYALTAEDSIIRFDKTYKISLEIKDAFTSVTNNGETIPYLAVDGLGNMYALGQNNLLVLKYSPAGKYMDQFGGSINGDQGRTGQFEVPSGIAVDGYGRIFITDLGTGLLMFDASGNYTGTIKVVSGYGVAVDDQNNIYVTTGEQVEKFQLPKPQGQ